MSWALSIPEDFTTGLTTLVGNFWTTLSNWLPTIIIAGLGVTAVIFLFRLAWRYGKRAFRG